MHYQGGKYRFIKHITPIIQAEIDKHQARHFISPFCGACNIESAIVHTDKTCNDKNAYIIRMWQELQQGREFPSTVTEDMDELLDNTPNLSIFVSEQTAPSGWREVWQKECLQEVEKNPKNTGRRRIERLFYKSNREEQDGHIKA